MTRAKKLYAKIYLQDENHSFRIAIFGPGIESRRNKKFIFKMINTHSSSLNAKTFVPGLPGGLGSGVRIDLNNVYTFDLICLYTNTLRLREMSAGQERLEAAHNRLLKEDVKVDSESNCQGLLNDALYKLFPTLDGFIFALDIEGPKEELSTMSKELQVMTSQNLNLPLLILLCWDKQEEFEMDRVISTFRLQDSSRSWAIFKVNTSTMIGLDTALNWLLYNCQKSLNFNI